MNGLNRWMVLLYLVAIFIAGGVSGWMVATRTARQKVFTAPRTDEIAASLRQRMHAKLDLTDEQQKQIDGIIERSSAELQSIHRQSIGLIRQALSNRNAQFSVVLTPDQLNQFEQIERERQESWRATNGSRGHGRWREHGDGARDRRDLDRSQVTHGSPPTIDSPDSPAP